MLSSGNISRRKPCLFAERPGRRHAMPDGRFEYAPDPDASQIVVAANLDVAHLGARTCEQALRIGELGAVEEPQLNVVLVGRNPREVLGPLPRTRAVSG